MPIPADRLRSGPGAMDGANVRAAHARRRGGMDDGVFPVNHRMVRSEYERYRCTAPKTGLASRRLPQCQCKECLHNCPVAPNCC